jgi:hypothetical protein
MKFQESNFFRRAGYWLFSRANAQTVIDAGQALESLQAEHAATGDPMLLSKIIEASITRDDAEKFAHESSESKIH